MPRVKKEVTKLTDKKIVKTKTAAPGQTQDKLASKDKTETTRLSLTIPAYSLAGRAVAPLSLPKEYFGIKVNNRLLAQALRVYMTNQRTQPGSTKGRGEVEGSTAKIYRQKGTGRARHGAIRAPIFVGGGITFGPKPRKTRLNLPKKMKKAALISALSSKLVEKNIIGLTGMERSSGQTKQIYDLLNKITGKGKGRKSVLIITDGQTDNIVRAVRNIPTTDAISTDLLNALEILRHDLLFITDKAIAKLKGVQT